MWSLLLRPFMIILSVFCCIRKKKRFIFISKIILDSVLTDKSRRSHINRLKKEEEEKEESIYDGHMMELAFAKHLHKFQIY